MASGTGQISQLNKNKKTNKITQKVKRKCSDSQSKIFLRNLQRRMRLGTLEMLNLMGLK